MCRQSACAVIMAGVALLLLSKVVYAYDLPAQVSPQPLVGPVPTLPPVPGGLSLQAVGTETGSFDSNPLLVLQGAKALWGSSTAPELIVNDSTPTLKLSTDTSVVENIFNLSSFDSTDVHNTTDFQDQKQQWSTEMQERFDYDTTRTSELSTFGISQTSVRHTGISLAPQISYSPTAVDKISLTGSGQYSTYASSAFTDYEVFSVTPGYSHNFDPLNAGTFSVQAQRYKTLTGQSVTVDSVAPTIGWNTVFTPQLIGKANVGLEGVQQSGAGVSSSTSVDYVFSADLTYKAESDVADLTLSRAEYPFSNGTESLLTTFGITESHVINQDFSLNVGGSYQSATYPTTSTGSLDSIASANLGLAYHATEHIDVTAGYAYRYETLVGVSGSPQDHTGTIGLVYRPKPWTL